LGMDRDAALGPCLGRLDEAYSSTSVDYEC
jgi:hypothetical protein